MHIKKLIIISMIILLASTVVLAQTYTSPKYSLSKAGLVSAGGAANSNNYFLSNAAVGNVFGGRASNTKYSLQAGLIPNFSVILVPLDWVLKIKAGRHEIKKINVKNNGDISATYSLRVVDSSGTWEASSTPDGNDENKFVLSAIFTDVGISEVDDADFNASGNEDIVVEDARSSTEATFATSRSPLNGVAVKPLKERGLWIKFTAPKIDTTSEDSHNLWLIIKAKEVK